MNMLHRIAAFVGRLGLEDANSIPRYATEHPVAKGVGLSALMLEGRVGR
ncbi:MAG: hypothetical protein QF578_22995 [Alphaproteobacteria bacterium]|jgi:hypothetical protein|nr:hypothetical protein [Alphaproteobacteria bacterium]MDP6567713.1 hypothetical protein [Alphaproteobacteria bacterium]MDP6812715.1 hypothetical protein [Alphaproteobacteria bacterium]|tara:strand:- start:165 stop:311 length:147 start_codon:yes stop_codon:yes gene_type:complete